MIELKDDSLSYTDPVFVKNIIKKYSNFVGFPIYVNGKSLRAYVYIFIPAQPFLSIYILFDSYATDHRNGTDSAGEQVNTIRPLWTLSPSEVSEDDHVQFYRLISNAYDKPMLTLSYRTDAPVNIRSVLYVPEMQSEKMGFGRMEPGVALYCRKVHPDTLEGGMNY